MFGRAQKASGKQKQKQVSRVRLYSIAGLLNGRNFAGSFDVAGQSYKFTYGPAKAEIISGRLSLSGRLSVADARGQARTKENVRAMLIATQGGVGAAPVRRQLLVGGVSASTASSSNQQQQQAGGVAGNEPRRTDDAAGQRPLPDVEATGPLSFCGVMYFKLEAIDPTALSVPADLSDVQLNVRLAPTEDAGRALHGLYCTIVDALHADQPDARLAAAAVAELNKLLAG